MITTTTNTSYKSDEGSDICSNNNVTEDMTTATTTTIASDDDDIYFNGGGSGSGSGTAASTTEEEEDMANCLILLAQGHSRDLTPQHPPLLSLVDHHQTSSKFNTNNNNNNISANPTNKFISRRFMETPSTTSGKSGYYVYECKTCGKTFSSFQALGGHRASHKKPKNKDEDYTNKSRSNNIFSTIITSNNSNRNNINHSNLLLSSDDEEPPFKLARHNNNNNNNNMNSSTSLSLQLTNRALYNNGITNHQSNSKGRVHECSICGAEFSSGQALGGHMRRHRGPISASSMGPAPIIRAVPLSVEQAPASTDMSIEDMMMKPTKIPPVRNTSTSVLSLDLDLNLPAPPEDNAGDNHQKESKFMFDSIDEKPQTPSPPPQQQQQQLVFSSPALVDCHY